MKSLLTFILVGLIIFLLFGSKESYDDAVPRVQRISSSAIQDIIDEILKKKPSLAPLDTVFVDATGPTTVSGRFLFLDRESYVGVQYDVTAQVTPSGVRITDMTSSVNPELSGPFMPFKQSSFSDVGAAVLSARDPDIRDAGIEAIKDMPDKI